MHSAFILTELRYPAVPLAGQLDHKRFVHPGPLVLRAGPLKSPTPTTDRDRTVSRRSEPSSRTALIGEQPNPWELLHPQDAMSRKPPEPSFARLRYRLGGDRPSQTTRLPLSLIPIRDGG